MPIIRKQQAVRYSAANFTQDINQQAIIALSTWVASEVIVIEFGKIAFSSSKQRPSHSFVAVPVIGMIRKLLRFPDKSKNSAR